MDLAAKSAKTLLIPTQARVNRITLPNIHQSLAMGKTRIHFQKGTSGPLSRIRSLIFISLRRIPFIAQTFKNQITCQKITQSRQSRGAVAASATRHHPRTTISFISMHIGNPALFRDHFYLLLEPLESLAEYNSQRRQRTGIRTHGPAKISGKHWMRLYF